MGEGTSTPETIEVSRPKLLYHGTANRYDDLFREHGLFANRHTLTTSLELALDKAPGSSLLTCWYPKKMEIEQMRYSSTMPAIPLSEEKKNQILEEINKKQLDPDWKDIYAGVVNRAKTLLPNSSLGAIIKLDHRSRINFEGLLPSKEPNFLLNYVKRKEVFVANIEKALNDLEVTFFNPDLNRRRLAEDIVRTELEHYLLEYGRSLTELRKESKPYLDPQQEQKRWTAALQELQGVNFQEPVYERYRQNLISRIINYTNSLQAPSKQS